MSTDPVVIEDDDANMEPVVVLDEDDDDDVIETTIPVETINLDDYTPTENHTESVLPNDKTKSNISEESFIINLRNNELMDKIVKCCINMKNALGMARVINKTVLPLYRDANVRYKQSNEFRKLLKNTYKSLIMDPDHKFLHVKTLCEELKSGGLRRNVPFVTLSRDLNNDSSHLNNIGNLRTRWASPPLAVYPPCSSKRPAIHRETESERVTPEATQQTKEIEGSSTVIPEYRKCLRSYTNRNKEKNKKLTQCISEKESENKGPVKRKPQDYLSIHEMQTKKNCRRLKQKTDVINLDNSDNESVTSLDNDNRNEITVTNEQESHDKGDKREITQNLGDSNAINVSDGPQETLKSTSVAANNQSLVVDSDRNVTEATGDSNKENKELTNENHDKSDGGIDYELLIPQNQVEVVIERTVASTPSAENDSDTDTEKVARYERTIATYQRLIAKLEESEVSSDSMSPYLQCAHLKKQVVQLYKMLCEAKGQSEDIVKRREVRLHVAPGHPPGPAKRLEEFLNDSIDSTGSVAFPDFADVAKCVIEANIKDDLGWNTQRIFKEASSLFRQCGQALRKRRQKREYRDLLSLVKDKELTDDPAERDPLLLAKLEENKRIAKVKEDDLLERYVNMELRNDDSVDGNVVNTTVQFETNQDSSESESDSEPRFPINNGRTAMVNQQCSTGESSKTNNTKNVLDVRLGNNLCTTSDSNIVAKPINKIVAPPKNYLVASPINKLVAPPMNNAMATPVNNAMATQINNAVATPINNAVATPVNNAMATPVNNAKATPVNNAMATPVTNAMATPVNNAVPTQINPPYVTGEISSGNIISNSHNLFWKPVNNYIVMPPVVNYASPLEENSNYNNDFSYCYVLSTNNIITNDLGIPHQILNNSISINNNLYLTVPLGITPSVDKNPIPALLNNSIMRSENNIIIQNLENGFPNSEPCISSVPNSMPCTSKNNEPDTAPSTIEPNREIKVEVNSTSNDFDQNTVPSTIEPDCNIKVEENSLPSTSNDLQQNTVSNTIEPNCKIKVEVDSTSNDLEQDIVPSTIEPDCEIKIEENSLPSTSNDLQQNTVSNTIEPNCKIKVEVDSTSNDLEQDTVPSTIEPDCEIKIEENSLPSTSNDLEQDTVPRTFEPDCDIKIEENSLPSTSNNLERDIVPSTIEPDCDIKIEENSLPTTSNNLERETVSNTIEPDGEIKAEVKKEPIDVQSMLDELGDNFVCTVFDIEDPFLVIEISSDGFSDDEL